MPDENPSPTAPFPFKKKQPAVYKNGQQGILFKGDGGCVKGFEIPADPAYLPEAHREDILDYYEPTISMVGYKPLYFLKG